MRVIVIGSQLNAFSTAYHLADIGYEVTVLASECLAGMGYDENKYGSTKTKSPYLMMGKKEALMGSADVDANFQNEHDDSDLFSQAFRKRAGQIGVLFRDDCKLKNFITQNKRIRGVAVVNRYNHEEIMIADKFVLAMDVEFFFALKKFGLELSKSFREINSFMHHKVIMGQTCYANLYLNLTRYCDEKGVIAKSGQILAEYIYNPSSNASHFCQLHIDHHHSGVRFFGTESVRAMLH
jgi:hypothetical protein